MNILIETDRLFITEMTMDMVMDVHKNSLDEDIRRFVPDEVFETPEDARETVEFLMSQYGSADGPLVYAVILKEGDKNIGYVQLVPLGEGKWEIGYHVAKPYTCKGYATEAVTAFLPVMAEKVGINEVYGIRLLENAASGRVLEKCGFKTFFVGESQYHDGVYAISKSVWKAAIMEDEIKTVMPEEKKEVLTPSAAILIPIVRENDEPALLMEVRSMNVWQPGEICFPGGHIEAGEDCIDTALRETYEELGIRPSSVSVLKTMEPERHMEKMLVYPVVGKIDPFEPDCLILRQEEVSEVFTLPFSWLLSHEPAVYDMSDPESEELPVILRRYLRNYKRRGTRKTTCYWAYERYGIWGLTARLLVRFRELLLTGEYPLTRK